MKIDKDNPLLFINTFLRRADEQEVSAEDYAKVSKGKPDVYNLNWQAKVRRTFFKK